MKKSIVAIVCVMSLMVIPVSAKELIGYDRITQPTVKYEFEKDALGVVNFESTWGDIEANIKNMEKYINEADEKGVKILLFPEMCTTGYASSSDPNSEVYQMAVNAAETKDGPIATKFANIADEKDMWIIYGGTEKIENDDSHAYNSAFACSPEGKVLTYQKIAPVEGEWCVPGKDPLLIDAGEYGLLGISICYDTYANPEIERYYAAMGCNILLNPTATSRSFLDIDNDEIRDDIGWEWYYQNRLETIASRDGLTIMSANLVKDDGPIKKDGTSTYHFPGGSVIMNGTFSGASYYAGAVESNGTPLLNADIITDKVGLLTNQSTVKTSTGSTMRNRDFLPEYYTKWYEELAVLQEGGTDLYYNTKDTEGPVAGVVNMPGVWGDKKANVSKIIEYIEEAADKGVEFLVFPETVVSGYEYIDPKVDSLVHTDKAMQVELAETIPGPTTEKLAEYAKKYNMYIVVGMTEKEEEPIYEDGVEKVYNSAAILYPNGKIESYQKMHRAGYETKWSVSGSTPLMIDTEWGKFGVDICRDGHFYPELGRYYAAMGCNVLVHPTATTGNPWYRESRIGSYTDRDGMAAITCNLLGPDGVYDEVTDTWSGGVFNSTSLIITKYIDSEGNITFNKETGSQISLNGTGSESKGYETRQTSPEGLEIAKMNLLGTGFKIQNFNPRLYSEMYDALASKYREGYKSLYTQNEWVNPYTDVNKTDWYYEAVRYTDDMITTAGDKFKPNEIATNINTVLKNIDTMYYDFDDVYPEQMTKKMLIDILFNASHQTEGDSVTWAIDKGIIKGDANGLDLDKYITNAEFVTILMNL